MYDLNQDLLNVTYASSSMHGLDAVSSMKPVKRIYFIAH